MKYDKIVILMGGGPLILKLAEYLNAKDYIKTILFCSERHLTECFDNSSLENHLGGKSIKYYKVNTLNIDRLKKLKINYENAIAFSFGAPWIIKKEFLSLFNSKVYNFHGARFPQNRGGGGHSWQIMRGLNIGMCLVHKIDNGIDTGEILDHKEFMYENCKTPKEYMEFYIEQKFDFAKNFIYKTLKDYEFNPMIQPEYLSSYWPRLNTEKQAWIDWSWKGEDIYKFICAFDSPYVGAHTLLNGAKVYLKDSFFDTSDGDFHPFQSGIIYRYSNEYYAIAVVGGSLLVKILRTEKGRKPKFQLGDRLETPVKYIEAARKKRIIYTPKGVKDI